jgi:hypothetical protein
MNSADFLKKRLDFSIKFSHFHSLTHSLIHSSEARPHFVKIGTDLLLFFCAGRSP